MRYIVSLILLTGLAACSGSTSPNSFLMRTAGVGSKFVYKVWETDTTGQPTRTWLFTDSIIATNLVYADKPNVSMMMSYVDSSMDTNDLTYIAYESNGDISMRDSVSWGPPAGRWTTLPLNSKGTRSYLALDDTGKTDSYAYDGEENLILANHSFSTIKVVWTQSRSAFYNDAKMTIWISKETGWIVKQESPVNTWGDHKEGGLYSVLLYCVLK